MLLLLYRGVRTSIDLKDHLFRSLKIRAAQQGKSLKEIIETALEHELERTDVVAHKPRQRFPLLESRQPGQLRLSNDQIDNLLT